MKKAKKSTIILLGLLVFVLGVTAYTSIITVWDTNPSVEIKEDRPDLPEGIHIPEKPKTSATYSNNLTVDNTGDNNWEWAITQAWASGSGTFEDPYLIDGDTVLINNSASACINISNSHDVYFKISGVTVRNNASDVGIGIAILNSTNGVIIDVNASYNGDDGISMVNSHNITIEDSMMRDNHHRGIDMDNCTLSTVANSTLINNYSGIRMINSTYNLLNEGSLITDSTYMGIMLYDSDLNNVSSCFIYNNTYSGIAWQDSDNITVTQNDFRDQTGYGVLIVVDDGNSVRSLIYNNTFVGNGATAYDNGTNNSWDNGALGNYWSDYAGADLDDDGIGDDPYTMAGESASNPQDNYPIWDDGDSIAPRIRIVNPIAHIVYIGPPDFSLTIVEAEGIYNRWYTVDAGSHTQEFTGTTGIITATEWNRIEGLGESVVYVTITFYVNDTTGNVGSESVVVQKYFLPSAEPKEESDDIYMYTLTKNQIYVLLAFSFSISLILRIITLRTRKR